MERKPNILPAQTNHKPRETPSKRSSTRCSKSGYKYCPQDTIGHTQYPRDKCRATKDLCKVLWHDFDDHPKGRCTAKGNGAVCVN